MSSNKVKNVRTGIFIDGSNINWALKNLGEEKWMIDYIKLRKYLKKHYTPIFYNYYGCVDEDPSSERFKLRADKQIKFYKKLEGFGYNVITKPLKYLSTGATKGDMDVEITVDMMNSLDDVDNIILFSGDSDFLSMVKDAHSDGKYIRIFSLEGSLSWELKTFAIKNPRCNYIIIDKLKSEIEYIKEIE